MRAGSSLTNTPTHARSRASAALRTTAACCSDTARGDSGAEGKFTEQAPGTVPEEPEASDTSTGQIDAKMAQQVIEASVQKPKGKK
jgi:hypothetical protein